MEAQAAKWAPARRQFLAAGAVAAAALVQLGSLFSALGYDTGGFDGGWKLRVQAFSGGALVIGMLLLVAAYLSTTTAGDPPQAVSLGKKANLGVLALAAVAAFSVLLSFLVDLSNLGDDFLLSVGSFIGHVGTLVLLLAAAAGAFMAKGKK